MFWCHDAKKLVENYIDAEKIKNMVKQYKQIHFEDILLCRKTFPASHLNKSFTDRLPSSKTLNDYLESIVI